MAVTLGVSTFLYVPFAVFKYRQPILLLLYGITGFKIDKLPTTFGPTAEALEARAVYATAGVHKFR